MEIRATQESVDIYYSLPDLNQSAIKVILSSGIDEFLKQKEKLLSTEEDYTEKKGMIIGSAVDHYFSFGPESFYEKYYFSQIDKKPGDKPMIVIKSVIAAAKQRADYNPEMTELDPKDYLAEFQKAADEAEYYMNRKKPDPNEDPRWGYALKGEGKTYWEDLAKAGARQILADDENYGANGVIESIRDHRNTRWILEDNDKVILIYQYVCLFTFNEVPCKAMLDLIRIDLSSKTIVPFDFKVGFRPVAKFPDTMRMLRYDLQASFYMAALQSCIEHLSNLVGIDLRQFSIRPLAFIYDCYEAPGKPFIFPSTNILSRGAVGDGNFVLGWQQGIRIYKSWAVKNFDVLEMFPKGIISVDQNFDYNIDLV